jgi:hypothetical protein
MLRLLMLRRSKHLCFLYVGLVTKCGIHVGYLTWDHHHMQACEIRNSNNLSNAKNLSGTLSRLIADRCQLADRSTAREKSSSLTIPKPPTPFDVPPPFRVSSCAYSCPSTRTARILLNHRLFTRKRHAPTHGLFQISNKRISRLLPLACGNVLREAVRSFPWILVP